MISDEQLASWQAMVGNNERHVERLEAEPLRRYALAIGANPNIEKTQPWTAHWAFFLPRAKDEELAQDGHAKRGGLFPPVTLPRRMFAGSRIEKPAPLILGDEAELCTTIAGVSRKFGSTGELVFVEIENVIAQAGTTRIRESKTFVLRESASRTERTPLPTAAASSPLGEVWTPAAVNLFRFSAATSNAHRIHYDAPYATGIEAYPALVVHGPFVAAKLAELAARGRALRSFEFRAQAPLFECQPIYLQSDPGEVRAVRCDGLAAMIAKVEYV